MSNFFLKILNYLFGEVDIENEPSCNWRIVRRRYDPKTSIICRNHTEAEKYVKNSTFKNLFITKYSE